MNQPPLARPAPLSSHAALPRVPADIATACRLFYGRELEPFDADGTTVALHFEEVHTAQTRLQMRVRAGGHEFELQLTDPGVLGDVLPALSAGVPDSLRHAVVLHALEPLWRALQERLNVGIELLELQGTGPAFLPNEALGAHLSLHGGPHGAPSGHTAVLLRALSPSGWRRLAEAAACGGLTVGPAAHDAELDLALHGDPVGLTLQELTQMEPGDVLVLDARADAVGSLPVRLVLQGEPLPGARALCSGNRIEMTQAPLNTVPAGASRPTSRRLGMPDTDNPQPGAAQSQPVPAQAHANLDAVKVDIEFELGRVSLPLSALRSLAVGQVFDTAKPLDGDGIVLWCGGQRLGRGQLVAVGERLGVRIATLEPVRARDTVRPPETAGRDDAAPEAEAESEAAPPAAELAAFHGNT